MLELKSYKLLHFSTASKSTSPRLSEDLTEEPLKSTKYENMKMCRCGKWRCNTFAGSLCCNLKIGYYRTGNSSFFRQLQKCDFYSFVTKLCHLKWCDYCVSWKFSFRSLSNFDKQRLLKVRNIWSEAFALSTFEKRAKTTRTIILHDSWKMELVQIKLEILESHENSWGSSKSFRYL